MIEVIEVIWGSAGPGYVAWGGWWGVELVISWICEVSARAVGMGFAYGLRDFAKCSSRVFRIRLVFAKFVFDLKGGWE